MVDEEGVVGLEVVCDCKRFGTGSAGNVDREGAVREGYSEAADAGGVVTMGLQVGGGKEPVTSPPTGPLSPVPHIPRSNYLSPQHSPTLLPIHSYSPVPRTPRLTALRALPIHHSLQPFPAAPYISRSPSISPVRPPLPLHALPALTFLTLQAPLPSLPIGPSIPLLTFLTFHPPPLHSRLRPYTHPSPSVLITASLRYKPLPLFIRSDLHALFLRLAYLATHSRRRYPSGVHAHRACTRRGRF